MTVGDLIAKLSAYPSNARVSLLHPDRPWLLPIEITHLPAEGPDCDVDVIAITADSASDEIEGLVDKDFQTRVITGEGDRSRRASTA